jgi:hypothetical protein
VQLLSNVSIVLIFRVERYKTECELQTTVSEHIDWLEYSVNSSNSKPSAGAEHRVEALRSHSCSAAHAGIK